MSDPFLGEVRVVGFNFAPQGWALCQGQLMPISQNTALFSLLGTTFGGDGVNTFALPDYRGRSAVGMGAGPGLAPISQGQLEGVEQISIQASQMPSHTHATGCAPAASAAPATLASPANAVPAIGSPGPRAEYNNYAPASAADVSMAPLAISIQAAGGGQPLPLRNPYVGSNFIIALQGIYPSRN